VRYQIFYITLMLLTWIRLAPEILCCLRNDSCQPQANVTAELCAALCSHLLLSVDIRYLRYWTTGLVVQL